MRPPGAQPTSIELVYLTAPGCHQCVHGRGVLAEVSMTLDATVREVDLLSDEGRNLAVESRLPFPPGVFVHRQLIAHGRLSARALRRNLARLQDEPVRDETGGV